MLHLTRVHVTPQVIGVSPRSSRTATGQLVDSGGNFSMTNDLGLLLNVVAIRPFSIGMAAQESNSSSVCTHRDDFPLPMNDGSTFYTPMFYNPNASETILSPEAICFNSNDFLTHWTQSGSTTADSGSISFFTKQGAEVLSLSLQKRNGLYYTPVCTVGVDSTDPSLKPSMNYCIYYYYHSPVGAADDDFSLNIDDDPLFDPAISPSSSPTKCPSSGPTNDPSPSPRLPPPVGLCCQPFSVPTPKSSHSTLDDFVPKSKQIEADLWQARLGHCSDWQLKVLPMSADGLPSNFQPHPFASYDHYNQARIRKHPATRGKHPSRAVTRKQRWFMDFGFLRASQADYSRPDKSKERVVTSFDGYNSYLIIVDEYTKYVWVYLEHGHITYQCDEKVRLV
jgi:hypothetical protein